MMISCEKCQLHICDHAIANLPEALAEQVQGHLADCPGCRAELEMERRLRTDMQDLPQVSCPPDVTRGILAAIEAEEHAPRRHRPDRWVWPAAGLVAAGLALVLLLPGRQPTPDPAPTAAYSPTEIQAASGQAKLALARVAKVLNSNEQSTIDKVFGEEIPTAVGASLLHLTRNLQGET